MKRLRHRNIVSLFEVIDDPDSDYLYMGMKGINFNTSPHVGRFPMLYFMHL